MFASCMRSHGVPNYPDPTVGANGQENSGDLKGISINSSKFQAARQDCKQYEPTSNGGSGQQAPSSATQLKFAECMRKHGVTNFPDPSSNGETVIGAGIDVRSPTYQAAARTCKGLLQGG